MKVLFMCVANSARSQMAEGLAKKLFAGKAEFYSAGSRPSFVNPYAIKALREIDIDISTARSKLVEDIGVRDFDLVITLCAEEVCPIYLLGQAKQLHWPFPDPAAEESPQQAAKLFASVRDQIAARLSEELPALLRESAGNPASSD